MSNRFEAETGLRWRSTTTTRTDHRDTSPTQIVQTFHRTTQISPTPGRFVRYDFHFKGKNFLLVSKDQRMLRSQRISTFARAARANVGMNWGRASFDPF